MFGRVARLPIDINTESDDPNKRVEEYERCSDPKEDDIKDVRHEMNGIIKANILKAQEKQKKYYDTKHKTDKCFNVGATVLKKDFTRKRRKGGKLDYRWNGPFTIVECLGRGLFRLEETETGKVYS